MTVVALDTSFSLSAPGRFERAQQLAKEAIAQRAGRRSGRRRDVRRRRGDRREAGAPIARWRRRRSTRRAPGFGATRYRAALSARGAGARRTRAARSSSSPICRRAAGTPAIARRCPEGATIEVADVGALPPNLAVTAVRAAAPIASSPPCATPARGAREARVHLTIDGRPAGDATVSLGAESVGRRDVRRRAARRGRRGRGRRSATASRPTTCATRCSAAPSRPSVLVVTGSGDLGRDAFYVQQALAAGTRGATRAFRWRASAARSSSAWTEDRLAPHAAVLLLSTRGLERRGRELLAAYARSGGGTADRRRAGRRRRRRRRRARRRRDAAHRRRSTGREAGAARAGAGRRAASGLPARLRGNAATLGLVTFQQRGADRRRRLPDAGAVHDRRRRADRVPGGRGPGARARVRSRQPLERFSAARDVRAVPARGRALSGERARARVGLSRRRRAGRRDARRRASSTLADAARGAGAARRDRGQRRSARIGSGAAVGRTSFQSAVTRLKDAGGVEARVEARQQEDRQHLWQYALALMAVLLAAEGVLAARTVRAGRAGQGGRGRIGGSACGHTEPRTSKSEARCQRQLALGVGPQRQ